MATILIVDDYVVTQKVLIYKLQGMGHSTITASNGLEALERLHEERAVDPIALAILDIAMPEMDGLTLLRRLRADARFRSLPVIMLTASGQDADRLAAKAEGANAFLTKPVSSWDLTATVNKLLGVKT